MLVAMTEGQKVLYGGALWVGPVFLLAQLLLYVWLRDGPFTEGGKRRAARRSASTREELRRRLDALAAERAQDDGDDPPAPTA